MVTVSSPLPAGLPPLWGFSSTLVTTGCSPTTLGRLHGFTQPTDSDVHLIQRGPHSSSEMYKCIPQVTFEVVCQLAEQSALHGKWTLAPGFFLQPVSPRSCLQAPSLLNSSLPLPLAPVPPLQWASFQRILARASPGKLCYLLPPCGHITSLFPCSAPISPVLSLLCSPLWRLCKPLVPCLCCVLHCLPPSPLRRFHFLTPNW